MRECPLFSRGGSESGTAVKKPVRKRDTEKPARTLACPAFFGCPDRVPVQFRKAVVPRRRRNLRAHRTALLSSALALT